jgi:hypothetical protein
MNKSEKPDARLLVSSHCPHCHALETLLRERMAKGVLGQLDIINVEQHPEVAQCYGVRSVPWLQLGDFIFDEALTPADLDGWIAHVNEGSGQPRYITYLLQHGKLAKAIEWIEQGKVSLKAVVPMLADTEAKMNVRIGLGAIVEHFEATAAIREIVPDLIALLDEANPAVRTDACHYLSLTHSREVIVPLQEMLDDEDEQVRQVAKESLEELSQTIKN